MTGLNRILGGLAVAVTATFAAAPAIAVAPAFSSVIAFGDSLSDDGNLSALANFGLGVDQPGAAFGYYYAPKSIPPGIYPLPGAPIPAGVPLGRYSNGPVAVELLALQLGAPLMDFAIAGAKTGPAFTGIGLPPGPDHLNAGLNGTGVRAQATNFAAAPGPADPNALYVVWGGPNDFWDLANTDLFTVANAVNNLKSAIGTLAAEGAKHFLVPNMPNLGRTPRVLGSGIPGAVELATLRTLQYNGALMSELSFMDAVTPQIDIRFVDSFGALESLVANPGAFGFTNVSEACLTLAGACANPNEYIFWDEVHPTARAHQFVAAQFAAAVPEPESYAMLLAGLGLLGIAARRRRATAA